jgi:hypothetical protein
LADSGSKDDQALAKRIAVFVKDMPVHLHCCCKRYRKLEFPSSDNSLRD